MQLFNLSKYSYQDLRASELIISLFADVNANMFFDYYNQHLFFAVLKKMVMLLTYKFIYKRKLNPYHVFKKKKKRELPEISFY